jgi:hypothetical protein
MLLFLARWFSSQRHVSFQLTSVGLFGTKNSMSTLKNLGCRKNTFQKVTQFSQLNNVLDASDSNTDGFLFERYMCFSTQLHMPIWNKESLSPL